MIHKDFTFALFDNDLDFEFITDSDLNFAASSAPRTETRQSTSTNEVFIDAQEAVKNIQEIYEDRYFVNPSEHDSFEVLDRKIGQDERRCKDFSWLLCRI